MREGVIDFSIECVLGDWEKKMRALIYTSNDLEYQSLERILEDEAEVVNIHYGHPDARELNDENYDLVIIACDDDSGLQKMQEWKEQDSDVQIIWIANDEKYLKDAFKHSAFDCFTRPYEESRVRHAIRTVLPKCRNRFYWQFGPGIRRPDP